MSSTDTGRKAQANGAGFERSLNDQHAIYKRRGACVTRLGPPTISVMVRKVRTLKETAKGPPDYLVMSGDIAYLFEAKHTEEASFPLARLEHHQAEYFDSATLANRHARCGIVVQINRAGVWWLPWRQLAPLWWRWWNVARAKPGEGSLTSADCDRIGRACVGLDWLAAAKMLEV